MFASSPDIVNAPRGRWYLNERDKSSTSLAARALAMVSPLNPEYRCFSNSNDTECVRSMSVPAGAGRRTEERVNWTYPPEGSGPRADTSAGSRR